MIGTLFLESRLEGHSLDVFLEPGTLYLEDIIDKSNKCQYIYIRIVFF